jgi:hypothetical protein
MTAATIATTNGIVPDDQRQLGVDIQGDVARAFAGKLWCYVAVTTHGGSALGVAVANEKGYSPVPTFHYLVRNHNHAEAEADRLNELRGTSKDAAMDIVLSSMRIGFADEDDA